MLTIQLFILAWEKSYKHIYHSPAHVSVIPRNILITIIRFACYHLIFAPNSIFKTDSMNLGTYLSKLEWTRLFNFNYIRDMVNRRKLFSIPVAEHASFSHQAFFSHLFTLKTNLLGLIANFSKYYFKTGTIYLLSLSSHVFASSEFDSNHFGILLWKKKNKATWL